MPTDIASMHAQLEAWRAQGADRIDPLRFALMHALARRAESHTGSARQRLEARLQELAHAYTGLLAAPPAAKPAGSATESPLKALLEQLRNGPQPEAMPQIMPASSPRQTGRPSDTAEPSPAFDTTPLPVLDEFQQLWTRIRIDSLLRQCLDGLPEDAGPLHSTVLTYRAMALMREVSPDYLQHFIAYTDTLTWLEQLTGGTSAGSDTEGMTNPRRPARTGTRRKKPAGPQAT